MKNLTILALILISIATWAQTPIPVDCDILINMDPIDINKDPIIKPAELLYDIIEVEGETEPEEEEQELVRVVYWVHGLGGNGTSWSKPALASEYPMYNVQGFHARYIDSYVVDYNDFVDDGLSSAANYISSLIRGNYLNENDGYNPDRSRNFIIAHSQGGLVSRSLLHHDFSLNETQQTRGYGGLVTVASPLQGALVLNNQDMILQMATDACYDLSAGPLLTPNEISDDNYLKDWALRWLGRHIQNEVCAFVPETFLPILFKDNLTSITNDYYVGSDEIDDFNSDMEKVEYVNMPKVAFYGVEPRANILWRTAQWIESESQQEDFWDANDDWAFYDETIEPIILEYRERTEHYYQLWEFWNFLPGQNTPYTEKYEAWKAGEDWLNQANTRWESVIGALEYDIISIFPLAWESTIKESDGVVVAESAVNLPGMTNAPVRLNGIWEDGEWTGSTHMQIRNDGALKEALEKLYDGQYGWFFYTKRR
jgi:pimeloyl-ACP methyl ester carboxylesterase